MKLIKLVLFCLTLICFLPPSQGKVFRNAYLSFELPDGWNCVLESTEWICRNQETRQSKEAIIIFTAKEVGPTDSYAIYEQTINTPRTVNDKSGKGIPSQIVMRAKQTKINDQLWVDGLQKGSEIPNYFTRYLATIKEKIAILVTFSAHADHFAKYSSEFYKAVLSLRVIASKNLLALPSSSSGNPNTSGVWGAASTAPGGISMDGEAPFGRRKKNSSKNLTYILMTLGGLLVVAGVFFFMKTKKR